MSRSRSFVHAREGSAAVQFALVAAPFLAFLYGALQIFLIFFAQQALETAAEAAGRKILTGSAQTANLSQSAFKTAVCQQLSGPLSCANLMVDVQVAASFSNANTGEPTLTYDANGNVTNPWAYNPGTAGSIVVMRLLYLWPVFNVPGIQLVDQSYGTHLLMATSVFKNEAYN